MTAPVLLAAMRNAKRGADPDAAADAGAMLADVCAAYSVMRDVVGLHREKCEALQAKYDECAARCAELQAEADRVPGLETAAQEAQEREALLANLRQQLDDSDERYIALRVQFDQDAAIAEQRIAALEAEERAEGEPLQQSLPLEPELPAPPAEWVIEIGERDANNAVRSMVIRPAGNAFAAGAQRAWRASIESKDGNGDARVLRVKAA